MTDFLSKLAIAWPMEAWQEHRVAIAVSGGADSVALLRGLLELAGSPRQLRVLHFNHQLRGDAADADEAFVAQLSAPLQIACTTGRPEVPLDPRGGGLEAAAREARYRFFVRQAEQLGCRYLVTGHTQNDQLETIVFRMLRGTGVAGLAGMPRARSLSDAVSLLRPMLSITRKEVIEYLSSIGQTYCDDATNDEDTFTRNRIRNLLLPTLEHEMPGCGDALLRLSAQAADAQRVIDRLVDNFFEQLVEQPATRPGETPVVLIRRPPQVCEEYLLGELFVSIWKTRNWPRQDLSQRHLHQLAKLLLEAASPPEGGAWMFPGRVQASIVGGRLMLKQLEAAT